VVLEGSGLSDAAMQRFAKWTNLSETTFVLPPTPDGAAQGADYRVRIFTPGGELPFAGHPTLGTCHVWLQAGGQAQQSGVIVQECGVGLVRIRRAAERLAFAAPPLQRSAVSAEELAPLLVALGLEPRQVIAAQHLRNGPHWLGLLLDSPDTVLALEPNHNALKSLEQKVGVAGIYTAQTATDLIARSNREARAFNARNETSDTTLHEARADLEVRAFAAAIGVNEDPVTGSLNASLAQWLMAEAHLPERYTAVQGACLGRDGRVHLQRDADGQVWVGGDCVTCIDGQVNL
jgi:PhzF family phenazine biosynthesis protein